MYFFQARVAIVIETFILSLDWTISIWQAYQHRVTQTEGSVDQPTLGKEHSP